jgi:hypothetical protein
MHGEDAPQTVNCSDQLPEDAPTEQLPDEGNDAEEGAARDSGPRHAQHVSRPRPAPERSPKTTRES